MAVGPTTASNSLKNGSATGATLAFNGLQRVPLPFHCYWGILEDGTSLLLCPSVRVDRYIVEDFLLVRLGGQPTIFDNDLHGDRRF